jgi:predicted Zn-dependent peptidase
VAEDGAPEARSGRKVVPDDTEQAYLCLGSLGASRSSEERYPEMVLSCALGGGTSSRLFQAIREERGLAYHVGSYAHSYAQTGALVIYAGSNARTMPQVLELALDEARSIARDGLEEEELERTKRQLIAGLLLAMESPASQVERLARSYLYHGRLRSLEEMVADLQGVTGEQVLQIARERYAEGPLALAAVGDLDEKALDLS